LDASTKLILFIFIRTNFSCFCEILNLKSAISYLLLQDVGEETLGTNISHGGLSYALGLGSSNQDESLNGSFSLFLNDEEDEWSGSGDEVEAEPEVMVIKDMVDIMKIDLHNFHVADIRKY
jgi:hypothetical protein